MRIRVFLGAAIHTITMKSYHLSSGSLLDAFELSLSRLLYVCAHYGDVFFIKTSALSLGYSMRRSHLGFWTSGYSTVITCYIFHFRNVTTIHFQTSISRRPYVHHDNYQLNWPVESLWNASQTQSYYDSDCTFFQVL